MKCILPNLPDYDHCTGCSACYDSCNSKAITVAVDNNGFLFPQVDSFLCVGCLACEKNCPVNSEQGIPQREYSEIIPYEAKAKNDELILQSASGGVFAQFAQDFLQNENTVVFGATLTENSTVRHISITDSRDIYLLQGAKYQQSVTRGVYRQTKEFLRKNFAVLFSGTPCQIAGLYTYLNKVKYNGRLLTAEVVCHGVPSKILTDLSLKYNNANRVLSYRTKSRAWGYDSQRMVFQTQTGERLEMQNRDADFFYRSFFSEAVLRPSCYNCPFARMPRIADITLADYWGKKEAVDGSSNGISLLLLNNSEVEAEFLANENIYMQKTDWGKCLKANPNLYTSLPLLKKASISKYIGFVVRYFPFLAKGFLQLNRSWSLKDIIYKPYSFYNGRIQKKNEVYKDNAYKKISAILLK